MAAACYHNLEKREKRSGAGAAQLGVNNGNLKETFNTTNGGQNLSIEGTKQRKERPLKYLAKYQKREGKSLAPIKGAAFSSLPIRHVDGGTESFRVSSVVTD